jgi:uncharacterized protein YndB with AHSA1/START domain
MRSKLLLFTLICLIAPTATNAEVADQAHNGFTLRINTIIFQAEPPEVYARLINIAGWWDPTHTYSNDAHNLSLDPRPLGCFCEKLPNNGGVRHMEVLAVMPNKMLVLSGALGPLQKFGATGTLTIVLQPQHKDTRIEMVYSVGGYLPDGLNTWAAPVDKVLTEQLARLKNYVESGDPAGAPKKQP